MVVREEGVNLTWSEIPASEPIDDSTIIAVRDSGNVIDLFRVSDIAADTSGRVYIANSGSFEILVAESAGVLRWRAGRRGDGPREFRALGLLQLWRADSIAALDGARNTVGIWSAEGAHGRTTPPITPEPDSSPASSAFWLPAVVIGMVDGGSVVMRGPGRASAAGTPGLRNVRTQVSVLKTDDGTVRSSFIVDGPNVYELRTPGRLPSVLAPMAGATALWVGDDRIVHASSSEYVVEVRNAHGDVLRRLRIDEMPPEVSQADREDYLSTWQPWFPVSEELPFPERIPSFDRVFVTADGAVWARRYHWGGKGEAWLVFRPATGTLRHLQFGPRVTIHTAAGENAYGIWLDENDVEHLVRFRIPAREAAGAEPAA